MNDIESSRPLFDTGVEVRNAVNENRYIDEELSEGTFFEHASNLHGVDEDHNGEKLSDSPPSISDLKQPSIELENRVLSLSQKGDWDACESTLNILQREAAVENLSSPLANITDKVDKSYLIMLIFSINFCGHYY